MFQLLMLAYAAAAQDTRPPVIRIDPPRGVTPFENRTLSQPHLNQSPETMFPDLAIKKLRIDGDTLHVLVVNQGKIRAKGPTRLTARAEMNGVRGEASPARIGTLKAGESRWVPLRNFSVRSAASGLSAPVFALEGASLVSAALRPPSPTSRAVDRTGQDCDPTHGCIRDMDETNNSLTEAGSAISHGRPE